MIYNIVLRYIFNYFSNKTIINGIFNINRNFVILVMDPCGKMRHPNVQFLIYV